MPNLSSLPVNFLFRLEVAASNPLMIPDGPQGSRLIIAADSGTFEGPKIQGSIVAGAGAEYAVVRSDGSMLADVRLVLQTDDGALILMSYNGIVSVDGEAMTIRTAPRFETGDERYNWLNKVQAVGLGAPLEGGVGYDVYHVL